MTDNRIAALVILAAIAWPVAGAVFGFDPGRLLVNLLMGGLLAAMAGSSILFVAALLIGPRRKR